MKYCIYCRTELMDDDEYCFHCGQKQRDRNEDARTAINKVNKFTPAGTPTKQRTTSNLKIIIAVVCIIVIIGSGCIIIKNILFGQTQDVIDVGQTENESGSNTFGPLDNAIEFNGHSYLLFDKSMTWDEANASCEETGGHLVTITSEA